jgi:hypothetical protein
MQVGGFVKGWPYDNLFPSIYKYYASHPIGYAVIQNRGEETINDTERM